MSLRIPASSCISAAVLPLPAVATGFRQLFKRRCHFCRARSLIPRSRIVGGLKVAAVYSRAPAPLYLFVRAEAAEPQRCVTLGNIFIQCALAGRRSIVLSNVFRSRGGPEIFPFPARARERLIFLHRAVDRSFFVSNYVRDALVNENSLICPRRENKNAGPPKKRQLGPSKGGHAQKRGGGTSRKVPSPPALTARA